MPWPTPTSPTIFLPPPPPPPPPPPLSGPADPVVAPPAPPIDALDAAAPRESLEGAASMTATRATPRTTRVFVISAAGGASCCSSSATAPMPTVPTTARATPAHSRASRRSPRRKWEKTARTATPPAATGWTSETGASEMARTMSRPPRTSSAMPSAHVGSRAYVPSTRASRTRRGRRFVPSFWSALPTLMHDAAAATTNTANSIEPEGGMRRVASDASGPERRARSPAPSRAEPK